MLFPFNEYWWFYGGFTLFVVAMLALDLGVLHRKAREVSFRESVTWSIVWVSLALIFCALLYVYADWKFAADPRFSGPSGQVARQVSLEFLTGFVIEKALALDNIFVFYVVFQFLAIPARYQHRVLFYGIFGALLFRVIFIAAGAALLQYHALVVIFGVLLILTGLKMFWTGGNNPKLENNIVIRLVRRLFPVTNEHSGAFFLRVEGKRHVTPLFIALVLVEVSDIIFAVDSVPAIFAVTSEPLLVFTSNVFAILGLRAMYFLIAGVVPRFHLIKYGLALILVFVGLKMAWLNHAFDGKFPVAVSLGIILTILLLAIVASCFPWRRSAGAGREGIQGESQL